VLAVPLGEDEEGVGAVDRIARASCDIASSFSLCRTSGSTPVPDTSFLEL
jgi:hypothetical protein